MLAPQVSASSSELLQQLFPSDLPGWLRWQGLTKAGKKRIVTRHGHPGPADYHWHLSAGQHRGIGLKPGIWLPSGELGTSWMMLDFDASSPAQVRQFMAMLCEGWTLRPLFNSGSTGRGAHLWFLFDSPVPIKAAHWLLEHLKEVATASGLEEPEIRPSSVALNGGSGVILPYRTSLADGYGPQALWDPESGAQLTLEEVAGMERSATEPLLDFRVPQRAPRPQKRVPSALSNPGEQATNPAEQWQAELGRVEPAFKEGCRQFLTIALTAFGLRLGLPPEDIEADVLALVDRTGGAERRMRQAGIKATLRRDSNGQLVAVAHFYHQAGLVPPARDRDPHIREVLSGQLDWMRGYGWPGRAGLTARSIYRALIKLADQAGHLHPQGVEVQVSWRQLGEVADVVSPKALSGALKYLEDQGRVLRAAKGRGETAGSFVLPAVTDSNLSNKGPAQNPFFALPAFRSGRGQLGKVREALFDLVLAQGPLTTRELARLLGRRASDLDQALFTMLNEGLVDLDDWDMVWKAHPDWPAALAESERRADTAASRQRQVIRHVHERDRYRRQPWVQRHIARERSKGKR